MDLNVKNLNVQIYGVDILSDIEFTLDKSICVGIVGESGSGKTMFARSVMGLLPLGSTVSGNYELDGEPIDFNGKERTWKKIRGSKIGLIMQDPFTSLDSMQRCGVQIRRGVDPNRKTPFDLDAALDEVGLLPSVADMYPFELSGGMCQRVVIAASLATEPEILIADEATTALDVITQKEILDLIDRIRKKRSMPLIIITHDLRIIKERTDYVAVFNQGKIVERGPTAEITSKPKDSYTRSLLEIDEALDVVYDSTVPEDADTILKVRGLTKKFGKHVAVRDVNLDVKEGECVGIVGQSGSGKTTLARCIIGLTRADSGTVEFSHGTDKIKRKNYDAQIVFQDPYSSLNPAMTVRKILVEALHAAGRSADELTGLLDLVEIPHELVDRKPGTLSGGQRQRIAIARALAPEPRLLICDESVSALDVLVQSQILATLKDLREKKNLAILFITHDLAVVRKIADRSYVMQDAHIVEEGYTEDIFKSPKDQYTKDLIVAIPGELLTAQGIK